MTSPATKGHVFLVTYGRSGSTVLQRILQSVDGAVIRGENHNTLYELFRAAGAARQALATGGTRAADPRHPFYGADRIDPARFERRLAGIFIDEILQPGPAPRWLGFKEIRSYEMLDDLEAYLAMLVRCFAGTRIIMNIRQHSDVMRSSWWATMDPDKVRDRLQAVDAAFLRYASAHPEHSLVVDYDRYKDDPAALQPLFTLLDEPFEHDTVAGILAERLRH